jgi:2,4-didehydro-3-deoxy-L-rhamnonate hydrolase
MIGATDDIHLPPLGEQHDWEAELCVVIAGGAPRHMDPEEASNYIAGYTVANDMHTCELFGREDTKWTNDWIAKQQPGFKAIGPFVVPKAFVPDLNDIAIRLKVNGDIKQDWPAGDMIFLPDQYVAYASERLALLPGDLLMMGSPPGNGAYHGQFLKPDDMVDIEIEGLGRQRHRCVLEDTAGRTPHFGIPRPAKV